MRHDLVCFACLATLLCAGRAGAERITATNSTFANVDGNMAVIRSVTFDGTELGFLGDVVLDVDISINFAKADGEDDNPPYPTTSNPFFNEIAFQLKSPGGTIIPLVRVDDFTNDPAFDGLVFDGTITFDDAAAQQVDFNGRPNVGTFRPVEPLSGFNSEAVLGTWELTILDSAGEDALRFREFTLSVLTPEPGSATLATVALSCLACCYIWRRRSATKRGRRASNV